MKITIDPEARIWFIRIIFFNICVGAISIVVLVLASLFLPPTLVDTWIVYIGAVVGCLVSISVYGVWGSASCLADINVWCMASLTAFGSGAIQSVLCGTLLRPHSASLVANMLSSCAPNHRRAIAFGEVLTVFGATFIIWITVRYLSWTKSRR